MCPKIVKSASNDKNCVKNCQQVELKPYILDTLYQLTSQGKCPPPAVGVGGRHRK